jgi:4-azaleucine resistance transporter AzlC
MSMDINANFRFEGALWGASQTLPLAVGDFAVGIVFGIAARHAGLDLLDALLMSGLVAAGTSQFVALGIWTSPLPVISIVITTLLVNLRYLLMSAGISPWMAKLPARQAYPTAFFLTDETFALTMREFASGG